MSKNLNHLSTATDKPTIESVLFDYQDGFQSYKVSTWTLEAAEGHPEIIRSLFANKRNSILAVLLTNGTIRWTTSEQTKHPEILVQPGESDEVVTTLVSTPQRYLFTGHWQRETVIRTTGPAGAEGKQDYAIAFGKLLEHAGADPTMALSVVVADCGAHGSAAETEISGGTLGHFALRFPNVMPKS